MCGTVFMCWYNIRATECNVLYSICVTECNIFFEENLEKKARKCVSYFLIEFCPSEPLETIFSLPATAGFGAIWTAAC